MALHIKLDHPSTHQLKSVFRRLFYALDMEKHIEHAARSCHQCVALQAHSTIPQTTSDPPDSVGVSFAVDVMKRERQLILVA